MTVEQRQQSRDTVNQRYSKAEIYNEVLMPYVLGTAICPRV